MRLKLAAILCAPFFLPTIANSGTTARTPDSGVGTATPILIGLNSSAGNDPDYDSRRLANEVAQAVAMHSRVVRVFVRPASVESAQGMFLWNTLDAIVSAYKAANIPILMNISSSSPTWMVGGRDYNFVPDGANLLSNPGFETESLSGWTQRPGTGSIIQDSSDPDTAANITSVYDATLRSASSANTYISQTVKVTPGQLYHLMFTNLSDGSHMGRYELYDDTHRKAIIPLTPTGNPGNLSFYRNVSTYFTAARGTTSVTLYLYGPTTSGTYARFDNAFILPILTSSFNAWVAEYSSFTATLVRRYASAVGMWELGNEVDIPINWMPVPDPKQYAAWYVAVHDAIKAIEPNALVSNAPFSGINFEGYSTAISASNVATYGPTSGYLDSFYSFVPSAKWPDAVSTHAYTASLDPSVTNAYQPNWSDIADLRAAEVLYQPTTPMWVTEFGTASQGEGSGSLQNQAGFTSFQLGTLKTTYTYVSLATPWMSYDLPWLGTFGYYGAASVFGDTLTPKPVSANLAAFNTGCFGGSMNCGTAMMPGTNIH